MSSSSPAGRRAGCRRAGPALSGSPRGAPSAARRGRAIAVPQEASEARSAGHGAKASGIEARQGRDAAGGSMRSTKARPARATPLNDQEVVSGFGKKSRTLRRATASDPQRTSIVLISSPQSCRPNPPTRQQQHLDRGANLNQPASLKAGAVHLNASNPCLPGLPRPGLTLGAHADQPVGSARPVYTEQLARQLRSPAKFPPRHLALEELMLPCMDRRHLVH